MRNAVSVSIIIALSVLISACGGGSSGSGGDIGRGIPNDCSNPALFNGNNPNLPFNAQNGDVTASYILPSGCYQVERTIVIKEDASLTISPRTTLIFSDNGAISVDGGSLIANGTPNNPIYFTGQIKQHGSWVGISINKRNQMYSSFNYVVIEYAGGSVFDITRPAYSLGIVNFYRTDNIGRVNFTNSIIRKSAGEYAFYAESKSYLEFFDNNRIYDNQGYPIHIHSNEVHLLGRSNTYTFQGLSNTLNKIHVFGDRLDTSKAPEANYVMNADWSNQGIPYLITEDILIFNTNLSLEPGTEVQFKPDAGFGISQPNASFNAKGTQRQPVRLTLDDTLVIPNNVQNTFWKGLRFYDSNNSTNRLNYTIVEYGGDFSDQNLKANLYVTDNSQVAVNNSILRSSGGYGLNLESKAIVTEFKNNTLTLNQQGAANVSSKSARLLDSSNNFLGNLQDYIRVNDDGLNGGDTWSGLNVPYAFFEDFYVDRSLTLEAGAVLLFNDNVKMEIKEKGSLIVKGTRQNPVKFSSVGQAISPNGFSSSYWQGLVFRNSPGTPINEIDNALIEYAGYSNLFNGQTAAISLRTLNNSSRTQVTLKNTTISNLYTGSWGVFKDENSTLVQAIDANNNLFSVCNWQQFSGACSAF